MTSRKVIQTPGDVDDGDGDGDAHVISGMLSSCTSGAEVHSIQIGLSYSRIRSGAGNKIEK